MKICPVQTAKNEHVVTINFQSCTYVQSFLLFIYAITYLKAHLRRMLTTRSQCEDYIEKKRNAGNIFLFSTGLFFFDNRLLP